MLASDLNNPEFAGALNPDDRLAVKFYSKPVKQEFLSEKEGRPIYADADFVQIFVPGDATTIIDTMVREDHKERFPRQWAHFMNKHGGDAKEIGTPLAQVPWLTPSQVEELKALKFYTAENVANASDANLQRIGMVAGMSPYVFREKMQRFLAVAADNAVATRAEEEAKAAKAEVEALRAQLEELKAMVEQPNKRGRPRKPEQDD